MKVSDRTQFGVVRTRWTRRPAWYTARGWVVLAVKAGLDYSATLVGRA